MRARLREIVGRALVGLPVEVQVRLVREVVNAIQLDQRLRYGWQHHDNELSDVAIDEFSVRLRSAAERARAEWRGSGKARVSQSATTIENRKSADEHWLDQLTSITKC